jgi:hypothetical protein
MVLYRVTGFSFNIAPVIGTCLSLYLRNHLYSAASTFGNSEALNVRFLLGANV